MQVVTQRSLDPTGMFAIVQAHTPVCSAPIPEYTFQSNGVCLGKVIPSILEWLESSNKCTPDLSSDLCHYVDLI